MAPIIVDNEAKLKTLLAHITRCVREQEDQLVFIDLEGVNLSRFGKIAIMQMLLPPSPIVYLIDVHVLGPEAFGVAVEATSLKSILESRTTYKVFFDIRNDSDALYAHFGVNVAGVIDLQVLEYATRQPRGKFVNGLAKCIEKDLPYQRGWSLTKANGRRLFAPELGGRYEVFLDRPLATDIIDYCEQDLMLMPRLLAKYGPLLRPAVASQIQDIVEDRIRLSQTATFNGQGRHMAVGPKLAMARSVDLPLAIAVGPAYRSSRAHSNMPNSPEVELVCSTRLGGLCRLSDDLIDDLTHRFDALQADHEPQADLSSEVGTSSGMTGSRVESAADTITTLPVSSTPVADEAPDNEKHDDSKGSFGDDSLVWRTGYAGLDCDSDSNQDFTACSADDCGYCGKCSC